MFSEGQIHPAPFSVHVKKTHKLFPNRHLIYADAGWRVLYMTYIRVPERIDPSLKK